LKFFSDGFPGTTLNATKWSYGYAGEPTGQLFGTPSYATNAEVVVNNGLSLNATNGSAGEYSVGCINSLNKFNGGANGGWIQAEIKMPTAQDGLWAGWWLCPVSSFDGGQPWEVDCEWIGSDPNTVYFTLHGAGGAQIAQFKVTCSTLSTTFHDYTFNWIVPKAGHPGTLQFLFDGVLAGQVTNAPVCTEWFMVLDLCVSTGQWPGNTSNGAMIPTSTMHVNYVTVEGN